MASLQIHLDLEYSSKGTGPGERGGAFQQVKAGVGFSTLTLRNVLEKNKNFHCKTVNLRKRESVVQSFEVFSFLTLIGRLQLVII